MAHENYTLMLRHGTCNDYCLWVHRCLYFLFINPIQGRPLGHKKCYRELISTVCVMFPGPTALHPLRRMRCKMHLLIGFKKLSRLLKEEKVQCNAFFSRLSL